MLGFLVTQGEIKELRYLLKREMEEILFDIQDSRIDKVVKQTLVERYHILFKLFIRVAAPNECKKYIFPKKLHIKNVDS
jgi:hypothetical protein